MDRNQERGTIASNVQTVLESFRNLTNSFSNGTDSLNDEPGSASLRKFLPTFDNEITRFKMWAGNLAAHQSGSASLDHRLREAPHLQEQVIYLLKDISESLQDSIAVVSHRQPSWRQAKGSAEDQDQTASSGCSLDQDSDADLTDSDIDDGSPETSLSTLRADVAEGIDCLLRLSVAIANPAPHERFRKLGAGPSEDVSFYETHDIGHVKDKFPKVSDDLVEVLGKFITRRRQFFKYREAHHARLAAGLDAVPQETDTSRTEVITKTVASTLPEQLKVMNEDHGAVVIDEDGRSNMGISETSYATSAGLLMEEESGQAPKPPPPLKVPRLPAAAERGTFECPLCYRMISASTWGAWKRHVFGDLRPYLCLFSRCTESNTDFDRRHRWQLHVSQYHWRTWSCPFKCDGTMPSALELRHHIRHRHLPSATEEQLNTVITRGETAAPDDIANDCPLCGHTISGLKPYIKHVGRHLEQLALFALPSLEYEDGEHGLESDEQNSEASQLEAKPVDPSISEASSRALSPLLWLREHDISKSQEETKNHLERPTIQEGLKERIGALLSQHASTQPASTTPHTYVTTTSSAAAPSTPTRTHAVTQDPGSHRPTTQDATRSQRSPTLDSATRPPVIVMTTQKDRPSGVSSHSSNARSGSPIRDEYRSSEGEYYTQPASSIHSRNTARPYADQAGTDDYARTTRDRSDSLARDDPYRGSRHSVIYHTNPRQSSSTIDYGDDGYQYTNAGELARYDLDHSGPARSQRQESFDDGYYRPNINYNAEQRTLNVDTSPDLSRNYITTNLTSSSASGQYDNRGGPPPSTRGFDKIRGYDTSSRDVPPTAPTPPDPIASKVETPVVITTESTRRPRPVSLYQEGPPRSSHHDNYYRSRENERKMREVHDQYEPDRTYESERTYDTPYSHDDSGFGIRTEPDDYDYDDRRERRQEPKKRTDEELPRESDDDREDRRRSRLESKDSRRERRESKRGSDEDEKERTRFRGKVATGLGIAATAVGIVPSIKDDDKREKESSRRKGSDDERDRDRRRGSTNHERPQASERDRSRHRDFDRDTKEKNSSAFNPNDASELKQLKDQLAALKTSDKDKDKDKPVLIKTRTRSSSPTKESRTITETKSTKDLRSSPDSQPSSPPKEETRGRDYQQTPPEEKQVRVVSPPREKSEDKPLKGILKQPKVSFPEEPNPIREGVAPHKEDKKIREAPPGAKWTKISRKVINPEALTIGEERFEVRDDFVIVLRVLSKEEIQAYASATQVLRERRRREEDGENDRDRDQDDDDRRKHHRRRDEDDSESPAEGPRPPSPPSIPP